MWAFCVLFSNLFKVWNCFEKLFYLININIVFNIKKITPKLQNQLPWHRNDSGMCRRNLEKRGKGNEEMRELYLLKGSLLNDNCSFTCYSCKLKIGTRDKMIYSKLWNQINYLSEVVKEMNDNGKWDFRLFSDWDYSHIK